MSAGDPLRGRAGAADAPPRSQRDSIPWQEGTPVDAVFLAEVVDAISHPVFVKDRSLRYVLVNRAFGRLVGLSRAAILGRTDLDFMPKEKADYCREHDTSVFETQKVVVVDDETFFDAEGTRRIISTTKVPLFSAPGEVSHLIGMIHDITRLKVAEDSLRQTNEELERRVGERTLALELAQEDLVRKERLSVLGRLAGGVAHQIRNPLGAIKNAAYVLARDVPPGAEEAHEALEIIHDEVGRANQIITGLLDYARVRAAKRTTTHPAELLEAAIAAVGVPPEVTVRRTFGETPRVLVDPGQTRSALENLVRNAIDAMPLGGTLHVALSSAGEDVVRLVIRDTGGGIPENVRERLFEPLVTTKVVGLGLGLVTARTLIEGQGGRVACVEPTGPGAVFEVILPTK